MLDINFDITETMGLTKELYVRLLLYTSAFCVAECAVSILNFCIIEGGGVHL